MAAKVNPVNMRNVAALAGQKDSVAALVAVNAAVALLDEARLALVAERDARVLRLREAGVSRADLATALNVGTPALVSQMAARARRGSR